MVLVSRLILPIIPLMPRYRNRGYDLDSPLEEALRLVMRAAADFALEYEPPLLVSGIECVDEAVEQHGSALVLSAHFSLNHLLPRAVHDRGHTLSTVHGELLDRAVITGTSIPMHDIALSPTVLVQIRNALRRGSVVLMDADTETRKQRAVPLIEPRGDTLYVTPTVFEFAEKTGTPILFAAARAHGPQIRTTFARPHARTIEGMMQEFRLFVDEQARSPSS